MEACDRLRTDDMGRSLGSKVATRAIQMMHVSSCSFALSLNHMVFLSNLYSLLVKRGANVNVEACDGLRADDLGRSLGLDSADYIQRARQARAAHLSTCTAKVREFPLILNSIPYLISCHIMGPCACIKTMAVTGCI